MRAIMHTAVMALAGALALLLVLVCGCANVAMAQTAAAPIRLQVDASQAPLTEYVGRISSRHSARFKRRSFSV